MLMKTVRVEITGRGRGMSTFRVKVTKEGTSGLIANCLRPFKFKIPYKPTYAHEKITVYEKDPLPTQSQRNLMYSIKCQTAHVGHI